MEIGSGPAGQQLKKPRREKGEDFQNTEMHRNAKLHCSVENQIKYRRATEN